MSVAGRWVVGVSVVILIGLGGWLGLAHAPAVRLLLRSFGGDHEVLRERLQAWGVLAPLGFIVEAEGTILCFVIYLIPGFPKDIVCYLFGLSPMPFWIFAVTSTLGRIPGTWVLSAQGANTAGGDYVRLALLTALVMAAAIPLYYARHRIMAWGRGQTTRNGTAE